MTTLHPPDQVAHIRAIEFAEAEDWRLRRLALLPRENFLNLYPSVMPREKYLAFYNLERSQNAACSL